MLNPKLYEHLCKVFGEPNVVNEGMAGTFSCPTSKIVGMRRKNKRYAVVEDWGEKASGLAHVYYLKADEHEAKVLTGEHGPEGAARRLADLGPREVIITLGSRGSLLLVDGDTHTIPAFSPRRLVDATGCGDTYFAGYLSERMKSREAERAGRFAAAVATVKLEQYGPFRGSLEDVEALL